MITRLHKPLTRVIGESLVATITADGIELRGLRKRKLRKFVTWEQIASLCDGFEPVLQTAEHNGGKRELEILGAKL